MNTKTLFLLSLLLLVLTVQGQKPNPRTVAVSFGGECIGENYEFSRRLEKLIENRRRKEDYKCQGFNCLSSFAFDLNGDRRNEYFVRLSCGGTGNCTWGIFSDSPAKLRGTFTAWFFFIHKRTTSWSEISTYARAGGDRGIIALLAYRRNGYVEIAGRTERHSSSQTPFYVRMGLPNCS